MVIAIDSLASKSIERISSSIQISDTGIVPGAGVENSRKEISVKTLDLNKDFIEIERQLKEIAEKYLTE